MYDIIKDGSKDSKKSLAERRERILKRLQKANAIFFGVKLTSAMLATGLVVTHGIYA